MFGKFLQFVGSGVNGMEAADRWVKYGDGDIEVEQVKQMAQERGEKDPAAFYDGFRRRYNRVVDVHNREVADQRGESFDGDYCPTCGSVLFRGDCPVC